MAYMHIVELVYKGDYEMLYEIWLYKDNVKESDIRLGIYRNYPTQEFIKIIDQYKQCNYSASQYKKGKAVLYFSNGDKFATIEIKGDYEND